MEVTATASHGFQNSGLSDPACPWAQDRGTAFWFEYGGLVTTGTRYSEGTAAPSRPVPLTVDGIVIPLIEDEPFRLFDRRLHDPYPNRGGIVSVDATVIARVFARRMESFLKAVLKKYRGRTVAAVSHGGPVRIAACLATGIPPKRYFLLGRPGNVSLTLLAHQGGVWWVEFYNDMAHLEAGPDAPEGAKRPGRGKERGKGNSKRRKAAR